MAKDELHTLSSGGSGGGVSIDERSRDVKRKKIPRRGLSIAQLEKMRLERSGNDDVKREKEVVRRGLGVAQLEEMRLEEERRKREYLAAVYYNNLAVNAASPVVNFYFLQPASVVNYVDGKNYAWLYSNKMVGVKREFIFSHLDPSSVATKSRLVYPNPINPRDNFLSLDLPHSELAADANGEEIDLTLKL